ncbi:MAG: hypothetical protein R2862_11230 [Thermoanaerobaculia bacterium]
MSGGGERFWTHILGGATRAGGAATASCADRCACSRRDLRRSPRCGWKSELQSRSARSGLPEIVACSFAAKFGTPNMLIVALEGRRRPGIAPSNA